MTPVGRNHRFANLSFVEIYGPSKFMISSNNDLKSQMSNLTFSNEIVSFWQVLNAIINLIYLRKQKMCHDLI